MFIVLPNGAIEKVAKVVPIVEKLFEFNGKKQLLSEKINFENPNIKPNGLKFFIEESNSMRNIFDEPSSNVIVIGNLSPEEVSEITKKLFSDEKYDFSIYEFQKYNSVRTDYIRDNGKSNPFITDFCYMPSISSRVFNPDKYNDESSEEYCESNDFEDYDSEGDEFEDYEYFTDED